MTMTRKVLLWLLVGLILGVIVNRVVLAYFWQLTHPLPWVLT